MTGAAYAASAEMARGARRLPGLRAERRAHAAGGPQPPARGRGAPRRLRGARGAAGGARPRELPRQRPPEPRQGGLGRGAGPRAGARLPQRPGDGDRPDRDDRAGHGLRHHRHRAGLRAGEVQEARRRRLLQDHQPGGAGGARATSATARPRSPRSSPMPSATARSSGAPGDQRHRAGRARLRRRARSPRIEAALPTAFDIRFVFNQWTLGEDFCTGVLGIPAEKLRDPSFDLLRHLGFTRAQVEAANAHVCGTMTLEGAPHLRPEHSRSSTAPTPAARPARGISRSRATSG